MAKMDKVALASLAALASAAASPASATNLVVNGSFENGLTGWSLTNVGGGTAPVVLNYGNNGGYPNGAFGEAVLPNTVLSASPDAVGQSVAYFSSDTANPDSLTQMIDLIAGQTYRIGFDYYAPQNGINNPRDASLSLLVGNSVLSGAGFNAGSPTGISGQTWVNYSTTFVPDSSGPQALTIQFRGGGVTAADFAIDRVYASAVPEPKSWAMMIAGVGLVGMGLRRRAKVRFATV